MMKKILILTLALISTMALLAACNVTGNHDDYFKEIVETGTTSDFGYLYDEQLEGIIITRYIGSDESVLIPDSVTSIGTRVFFFCGLTDITIPDSISIIDESTFVSCHNLTSINIPDSVTSIGWGAFRYCSSLTDITIPNGVTSIAASAFLDCSSLTTITVPDSVTWIQERAFEGCDALTVTYKGQEYNSSNFEDLYALLNFQNYIYSD